jgi:hypothetical protein
LKRSGEIKCVPSPKRMHNNEMQRTSLRKNGASPLISVLGRRTR